MRRASSRPGDSVRFQMITHEPSARWHWRASSLVATIAILVSHSHASPCQPAASQAPLTLRTLLDSVRVNHPTVLAAERRIRAADGIGVTARAFGNPVLSYQVDQTPFPGAQPIPGLDRQRLTTVTLPLEALYQRAPRVARANALVRAAEADAIAVRQRVGMDAVSAFYRAATAQLQVATTTGLVAWLDTLVTYNRSRVKEGVAAEADLIRSELEQARMSAEATLQRAELAQARAALGGFLSDVRTQVPLPVIAIDGMPLALPIAMRGVASDSLRPPVARTSIDARPDIRAARERLAASNSGIAAERSMRIRQVGATIGTMQMAGTTSMIAGLSVPLPLFDQNRGEVQRSSAERDAAAFELAAEERTANAELRGAYDAAQILSERAAVLARRDSAGFLARADDSRRIALGAYREGAVPLFQVIDAARSWADAQMTYYRTVFAQHQSILMLTVAEGLDLFSALPAPTRTGDAPR